MDKILGILSNPLLWGVVLFIVGFFVKQKLNSYLKLVSLLVDAIEIIDTDIKDIVPDNIREKLTKIKKYIADRVGCKESVKLDTVLAQKNLLVQSERSGVSK